MPKALAPELREAIEADIRAGKHRNEIARTHGVSGSTVTSIARECDRSFDRSQTKTATAVVVADVAARRARLSADFIEIAALCNERARLLLVDTEADLKPHKVRDLAIAAGIYYDKHLQQAAFDDTGDEGGAVVDQWLIALTGHGKPPAVG